MPIQDGCIRLVGEAQDSPRQAPDAGQHAGSFQAACDSQGIQLGLQVLSGVQADGKGFH
jgi:hypothetical protein